MLIKTHDNIFQRWTALLFLMPFINAGLNSEAIAQIYTSSDLSGHVVVSECDPNRATTCSVGCSNEDATIASQGDHGAVTANVNSENIYVNAIGYKKFSESFPNNTPITLGVYRYTGKFRLPVLPKPNDTLQENPQAVHMMIQLWDGRNELYQSNKTTLEGAIYWNLNPWSANGEIKVYTNNQRGELVLHDTGLALSPDTEWHPFELIVDLSRQRYISIKIDDKKKDLIDIALAKVPQPEWGDDVSFTITTESMNASPQPDTCTPAFKWTTEFKDIELRGCQGAALVASVLPLSRSSQVGGTVTAFATLINAGTVLATGCRIESETRISTDFLFQTTDPATNNLIGTLNTPIDIDAGGLQTFVTAFTPFDAFAPTDVILRFVCQNGCPAPSISGLNTLLLSASDVAIPDIVALAATRHNDGIVHLNSTGVFSVATVNLGVAETVTALVETSNAALPVTAMLCETDPASGDCISAIASGVTTRINADATPTFGVFVEETADVPFDPANNRIVVRFEDAGGVTRGATSVAVQSGFAAGNADSASSW